MKRTGSLSQTLSLLALLAMTIAAFWLLQRTTPERIGSLIFFILVGLYALYTHRRDIIAACTVFFALFDLNLFLFDQVLPIWLGILVITAIAALVWSILFGRSGWFLAVAAILTVLELILATQYINIAINVQSLIAALPFIIICQHHYFLQEEGLASQGQKGVID